MNFVFDNEKIIVFADLLKKLCETCRYYTEILEKIKALTKSSGINYEEFVH